MRRPLSPRRLPISASGLTISPFAEAPAAATFFSPKPRWRTGRGSRFTSPFDEPAFLEKSVDFADSDWRARFFAAKSRGVLHLAQRELGPTPESEDPYERNNRWMLDTALRFGPDKVDFICLWNGKGGDGPGGTRHMMEEVRQRGGRTLWLDTTKLWD